MGSLYWQLNDCWPVASWASIDYYGHWKALHYYARRFYDDLLVSPWEENGTVSVYVVSDRLQPMAAELRVRVMDFQGKALLEKKQAITVPELSSKVYATFSREELVKGERGQGARATAGGGAGATDAQHVFAVFDLLQEGKVVSRNVYVFDRARNLALPAPAIHTEVSGGGGSYTLRLQSPALARHVYVSFGDSEADISDNYFDLLPNEPITLQVKSSVDVDQLRRSLRVRNITDAFPGESGK